MSSQENAKQRAATLKRLRTDHAETVSHTQALFKEQRKFQKLICQSIRDTAKTVPEIAKEVDMPTHKVLWSLTAYKKYDIVVEEGMCGEYVLYKRVQEN